MVTERRDLEMNSVQVNPFEITKAVDFTDREIDSMWVDWPAPGGFAEFMSIKSPMVRIIRGGKGTGRTHVMRHFSARVQTIRGSGNAVEQMDRDGVLGIYIRCSGLNSTRFRGRGIEDDTWSDIFAQYMDIWLAQSAIEAFQIVFESEPPSDEIQEEIAEEVWELFESPNVMHDRSLGGLSRQLFDMQQRIDTAVNNAALRRGASLRLDVTIGSVPGALVYGVPNALRRLHPPMKDITCLYLIDEFENFELQQQKYVNSLIREKPPGTSFVVGVRTSGLKTLETIAGGEENRPGSEFEWIDPDQHYSVARGTKEYGTYREFCSKVVARRLSKHGFFDDEESKNRHERLKSFFAVPLADMEERLVCDRFDPLDRPYLKRLKDELRDRAKNADGTALQDSDIEFIVDAVSVPSRPLLEKANALLIYQAWSQGRDLKESAKDILREAASVSAYPTQPTSAQIRLLEKYRSDFKAQLCNDLGIPLNYSGLDKFIEMSDGLPRNLLVIMKYVHRWALFNEEKPFQQGQISLDSQRRGLLDAAAWFLDDAKPLGKEGDNVIDAVGRLCNMFRRLRLADKLVESSLTTFSTDLTKCSERARQVVKMAEQWSLLIRVGGGQKDRSSKLIEHKYQVNRLLSPRWDLPTARRGAIRFNPKEMDAIFDPDRAHDFAGILNQRLRGMQVPFGRQHEDGTRRLFELEGYESGQ